MADIRPSKKDVRGTNTLAYSATSLLTKRANKLAFVSGNPIQPNLKIASTARALSSGADFLLSRVGPGLAKLLRLARNKQSSLFRHYITGK
jgi:hypothetical protein